MPEHEQPAAERANVIDSALESDKRSCLLAYRGWM